MKMPANHAGRHQLTDSTGLLMHPVSASALKGFRLEFYIGCAASILLVIVVGLVANNAISRQGISEKWVEHTYQVLRKTDFISAIFNQSLLPEVEGIKQKKLNLSEYQDLQIEISTLKLLVKDNRLQLQDALRLQQQVNNLMQASEDNRGFRSQVKQAIQTLERIKRAEELLLVSREKAYKSLGQRTRVIVLTGSALILGIVSFLIYVILKELDYRIRAYKKEHDLNLFKSTFVTMASHEFRTPLSSILLSAGLVEKYLERGEQLPINKHVDRIKHAVYHLEEILEDFLSLEKLEEGEIKPNYQLFDLDALCRELITSLLPTIQAYQKLSYEPALKPMIIKLDRAMIEKSLYHLLTNAIKYAGDKAVIWLTIEVTKRHVIISVKDNGVGIPEENQKQLSKMFYRLDQTGYHSGTGLGLHLVKRYTQLMNGCLDLQSNPGVETCFTIAFPRQE